MDPRPLPKGDAPAMMNLPTYAETKDSGVGWLGRVPAHWEVRRLRSVVDLRLSNVDKHVRENEQPVRLCNYTDVYGNNRILSDLAFMPATASVAEIKRFRLRRNDVLITKDSEDWMDIGVPALVGLRSAENDILCGYHCALLRPNPGLEGGYLFWLLKSSAGANQFRTRATGVTRYGLAKAAIGSTRLSLPPLAEQTAIVRFLDYVDRRIRRYIRAKEKLIALLEEEKQAVIEQAVTGQIDVRTGRPYPSYKESGVQSLGKVPTHWDLRPAKRFFKEADHRSETGSEELLSVSHITGVTPRSEKNVTMFEAQSKVGYKLCQPGDIVVNTMWAWMAALGVAHEVGIVSPSYAVYRPLNPRKLTTDYMDALVRTRTYQSEYLRRSTGIRSSRLRLYPDEFLRIRMVRPPLEEQRAIVALVDKALRRRQEADSLAERQRSLLQQCQRCLIADVVTGKLDVREVGAALPELDGPASA